MRNPKWTRDELILALDLYFRCDPLKTNKSDPEIIALSDLLNSLPIHPQKAEFEKFRNPNGVYMKLCNFLRLDPDYSGAGNYMRKLSPYNSQVTAHAYSLAVKRTNIAMSRMERENDIYL